MHSQFRLPFITIKPHMPIISQRICNIPSTMWYIRITNRVSTKIECFDSCFHLMIPKMHRTISPTCGKPWLFLWMKIDWIDRIQHYNVFFLCFVTLKCDVRFLKLYQNLPNYITTLEVTEQGKYWHDHQ